MNSIDLNALSPEQLAKVQELLTPKLTKYVPYDPTAKQRAFLLMNDKEILYGGAAGGGKSVAQLMGALQYVDIPGYNAILFRKTFADLNKPGALISMAREWLNPFVKSGEVTWSEKYYKYTFPSGATLTFGYLDSDNDCYTHQGAEYQYVGMDEVTHISPSNYRYLFSRLRKSKGLKVPLRFRATANPGGQYGEFYHHRFFIEGPSKGRIFIGAGLNDNPHLDKEEYVKSLDELDAVTKEQLLNGNWDVRESGGMFDRKWFFGIMPGEIPTQAKRVRFWDLASSDPKKNKRADTTVGTKLAFYKGIYYIEDIRAIKATPAKVEKLIELTASIDGRCVPIRMEQEPGSSGVSIIDHYARNVLIGYDFKGIPASGSKADRAKPVSSAAERGQIGYCKNIRCLTEFFDQLEVFPNGSHDDFVDSLSGAFGYFKKRTVSGIPTGVGLGNSYWKEIY